MSMILTPIKKEKGFTFSGFVEFLSDSNQNIELNSFNFGDRLEVINKIESESIDMIITSPPYNVAIEYKNHHDLMDYKEYLFS